MHENPIHALPRASTRYGLAAALLFAVGVAGCDAPTHAATTAATSCRATSSLTAKGQPPSVAPMRRLLLTATRRSEAADAEKFLATRILPLVQADGRVGNVALFSEGDSYAIDIQVRTVDPLDPNLAFNVLLGGQSFAETQKLIDELGKHFEDVSAATLSYRPELSITRSLSSQMGGQ